VKGIKRENKKRGLLFKASLTSNCIISFSLKKVNRGLLKNFYKFLMYINKEFVLKNKTGFQLTLFLSAFFISNSLFFISNAIKCKALEEKVLQNNLYPYLLITGGVK